MVILHVIQSWGMGGVERVIVSLLKNIPYTYVAINDSKYENFISHFKLFDNNKVLKFNDTNFIAILKDLNDILLKIKPDIVHTHARRECFYVNILNMFHFFYHVRTQHMLECPKIHVTMLEQYLLKKYVKIWISTSKTLQNNYLKNFKYINSNKMKYIYNGVVSPNITGIAQAKERKRTFCIISRLTSQKGIDIILEKISNCNKKLKDNIFIDIYGEGPELDNINFLIKKYDLNKTIKYCGTTRNPYKIFPNYKALLMPSRNEGLPLTMLEAMATGTPVAIHNVGCVSEFIKTGYNGWIIDENYSWQTFFRDILYENKSYEKIQYNALKTYLALFSEETMCKNYLKVYNSFFKINME